jgi:hypothetical protein
MRRKSRMQDPQKPDQALSSITRTPAVDVFGLAFAPSFLRAIYSIPSFGNREIRRQRLPPSIPAKRSAAAGASANFYLCFQMRRPNSPEKSGIEPGLQAVVITRVLYLVPLADNHLRPQLFECKSISISDCCRYRREYRQADARHERPKIKCRLPASTYASMLTRLHIRLNGNRTGAGSASGLSNLYATARGS